MSLQYDTPTRREKGIRIVETTAALRLQNGVDREVAVLLGTAAAWDRASILYVYDKDLTGAESGVAIIKPASISTAGAGRWRSVGAS